MLKKILSFDGGGVRGVISVVFLQKLEQDTGLSLGKQADLLTGTSTGSIIAGALAVGMTAEEILNFYVHKSSAIFQEGKGYVDKFLDLEARFSSQNLFEALQSAFSVKGVDPDILLGEIKKKIVIPTVNLDNAVTHRWRTEIMTNETKVSLIDAMMRSSAAPTYFSSYQDCVDGGMAANDPAVLAYATLEDREAVSLLSFGTGYTEHNVPKGEHWGALSWIIDLDPKNPVTKTPLLSMLFDVQDQLPGQICQLLLRQNYLRINLRLSEAIALDDASKIPQLIEEVEAFIEKNPSEWKSTCKWVESCFS